MFENQDGTDEGNEHPLSGRSSVAEGERPRSRVRSSFIAIDQPSGTSDINPGSTKADRTSRGSTADLRRESFSLNETDDKSDINTLKKTVSQEHDARKESAEIPETVPESAIENTPGSTTPVANPDSNNQTATDGNIEAKEEAERSEEKRLPSEDLPAEHPDKPNSSRAEEPGKMKPGDPKDKVTSSDASRTKSSPSVKTPAKTPRGDKGSAKQQSTPGTASTQTKSPSKSAKDSGRPAAISTTQAHTASPSVHSARTPTSASRPKSSGTQISSTPTKSPRPKGGRSSLTAPTASSVAKAKSHVADDNRAATIEPKSQAASGQPKSDRHGDVKSSTSAKARPKSPTRAVKLPSHLTAPTASSAAKQENAAQSSATSKSSARHSTINSLRASTNSGKPPASTRSSLAGSQSTSAKTASSSVHPPKPVVADGSFLSRMMRPTASSASKTHEKTEAKSPPRRQGSILRPKTNGHAKSRSSKTGKGPESLSNHAGGKDKVLRGTAGSRDAKDKVERGEVEQKGDDVVGEAAKGIEANESAPGTDDNGVTDAPLET